MDKLSPFHLILEFDDSKYLPDAVSNFVTDLNWEDEDGWMSWVGAARRLHLNVIQMRSPIELI